MQSPAVLNSNAQQAPNGAPPSAGGGAMSGGPSDFIGALISLISRADIRYQGFLASIDPVQATIALEKVRSWGTEGRLAPLGRGHEEIPPNDNIYDYIVFRAADVKDLQIDDPNPIRPGNAPGQQALQDPAILGSSGAARSPIQRFGGPQGGYGYGPGGPGLAGPPPPQGPGGFYGGAPHQQQPPQQPAPIASPAVTPAAAQPEKKEESKKEIPVAQSNGAGPSTSANDLASEVSNLQVSDKKSKSPSTSTSPSATKATSSSSSRSPQKNFNLPPVPHAATAAAHQAQQNQQRQNRGGVPGSGGRAGPNRRQGGGGGGMYDVPLPLGPAPVPEQDYDFETANKKFEDERKQAASKQSADPSKSPTTNGTGNEFETLDSIPPPEDGASGPKSFYDPKTTGFFDNISSEVKERHERPAGGNRGGRGQSNGSREDGGQRRSGGGAGGSRGRNQRMVEERRNLQTFGDTGNAGGGTQGRGGFNGRGNGRSRGRGRGGYRGGPNYVEA